MIIFRYFFKKLPNIINFIHKIYINIYKIQKKSTALTKTKAEVQGSGKKPWKQKGTGKARAGSLQSPLFVGGGISFGPKNIKRNIKINIFEKKVAIFLSIYLTKYKSFIFFISQTDYLKVILTFCLTKKLSFLVILPISNYFLFLKLRNYKSIKIITFKTSSLKDFIHFKCILYFISK